jgi:hypothetical protein
MSVTKPVAHELLIIFLIGQPTAVGRLLADHVDDGTGRCRRCGSRAVGDRVPWPCTIHTAAKTARTRQRRR